jgi:hypothetical protein
MKCYTFFNDVAGLTDPDLLELWQHSWAKNGWEPIILKETDAINADSAMFSRFQYSPLLLSCPTNPKGYTWAAMVRWIAMTAIDEPCMHVDWDVLSNGFRPEHAPKIGYPPTFFAGCTCPCAVFADGRGWKMIAAALEMVPHTPEFKPEDLLKDSCDQYALSVAPKSWSIIHPDRPCRNYNGDIDWHGAPMMHFPNATTPYPRSRTIRELGFGK